MPTLQSLKFLNIEIIKVYYFVVKDEKRKEFMRK